jgi:hypothetical protein
VNDQPVAEAATYTKQTQEMNTNALRRIQTRDPGNQAATDLALDRTVIGVGQNFS